MSPTSSAASGAAWRRRELCTCRATAPRIANPAGPAWPSPPATSPRSWPRSPASFAVARIASSAPDSWSILEGRYPEGLEPVAEAVAREGVEVALKGVPIGSFGKFVTVDRGEIEGFRSIRTLMREHDARARPAPAEHRRLRPPGAGKSFGVKAVVKSALDADRIEELTFNLSQMRDPSELADALHQVRDAGLRGKLPFVLWDEFDSDLGDESVRLAPPFPGADAGRRLPAGHGHDDNGLLVVDGFFEC